ncbi:MAG: hypothetical protein JXR37_08050 [Kiritimatiellae bacterium]|nr:hypothetical protein [Kiritimatiellia bacterium]
MDKKRLHLFLTRSAASPWLFGAAVVVALAALVILYLAPVFSMDDISPETVQEFLAVGHVMLASEKGVHPDEYFACDPYWDDVKRESPREAYMTAPKGMFVWEFFAKLSPLRFCCSWPFVKFAGVSKQAVALHSVSFMLAVLVMLAALGFKAYGRWHALLAVLFLLSSLSWLIHVKSGYQVWMPSVFLMCGIAFCLYLYASTLRRAPLLTAGALLGFLSTSAWISATLAVPVIFLSVVLLGPRSIKRMVADLALTGAATLCANFAIYAVHAAWYGCSPADLYHVTYKAMTERWTQGSVPAVQLPLSGRLAYAFRNMFVDMRSFDHLDKCLEGTPAISWLFTGCLFLGVLCAIKDRSAGDIVLLVWAFTVFGILGVLYLFQHRYALMGLPALALLGARGVMGAAQDLARSKFRLVAPAFILATGLMLAVAFFTTYRDYYDTFTHHKRPDFEVDRLRGHFKTLEWLKANCQPEDTLTVMSDPIMFHDTMFEFYTFDQLYRYAFWCNRFKTDTTPKQVLAWEREQLKTYKRIVYMFSSQLLGDPRTGRYSNDWRPFLAAHPGIKPVFTYRYKKDRPAILVFTVPPPAPRIRFPET